MYLFIFKRRVIVDKRKRYQFYGHILHTYVKQPVDEIQVRLVLISYLVVSI